MSKRVKIGMAALGAAALVASLGAQANATVIGLGDFSGNESLVDFSTNPAPSWTSSVTVGDATITTIPDDPEVQFITSYNTGSRFDNIPGASLGNGGILLTHSSLYNQEMRVDFNTRVQRAGILLSADNTKYWSVSVYDAGGTQLDTGTFTMGANEDAVFAGFQTSAPIAYMEIADAQPHSEEGAPFYNTYFDDLRFESVGADFNYLLTLYDQIVSGQLTDIGVFDTDINNWWDTQVIANYATSGDFTADFWSWWDATGAAHFDPGEATFLGFALHWYFASDAFQEAWDESQPQALATTLYLAAVPEPGTLMLLVAGAPVLLIRRRRGRAC